MGAMRRLSWLVLAAGLCLAALARAGEPLELLQGYDKARWGQTPEEVKALYGDKIKEIEGYQSGLGAGASLPDEVSVIDMTLPHPQPSVDEWTFRFLEGRLCAVEVTLTSEIQQATNAMAVAKILWDKYYADSGARAQLAQHRVLVSMRLDAMNLEPMSAVDLLPGRSGLLSTWYMNLDCWDRQVAQAQDRKQQEKEKARKAASENNLRQAL